MWDLARGQPLGERLRITAQQSSELLSLFSGAPNLVPPHIPAFPQGTIMP